MGPALCRLFRHHVALFRCEDPLFRRDRRRDAVIDVEARVYRADEEQTAQKEQTHYQQRSGSRHLPSHQESAHPAARGAHEPVLLAGVRIAVPGSARK
ncbi:MAG TPA: hypothetical protein VMH81_02220 [Bryobacteraceae bacterium]|nr:hypothetical protein [Bryobacteraceae bacterium]